MGVDTKRRPVLVALGGVAVGAAGIAAATDGANAATSEESFTILEGTEHETTGYVRTADADGPTVMVVGGIHGNEVSGYQAAAKVTDMDIVRGRLVTVPRTNVVAIEDGTRVGEDGVDLNRQFPTGGEPTTELARALWDVVERYEPDVFIDLHESQSLYEGDVEDGVGQAIFHSRDVSAQRDAREAAAKLNEHYVDDPTYDFTVGPFSLPPSRTENLFVHKVARDTDAVAFLAETVTTEPTLATRIRWHTEIVQSLVWEELLNDPTPDDGEGTDDGDDGTGEETNEPPVARIETEPANAADLDLSRGQTVTLDASSSSDPDGDITSYEWDVDGTDGFDEEDDTVEVTMSFCGELPVTLRVTGDDGTTATEEVVLSTG